MYTDLTIHFWFFIAGFIYLFKVNFDITYTTNHHKMRNL